MRNRFIVAFILAIPIFLYSPLATEVFGIRLGTPFGIDPNVLSFLLATPAVLWSGKMFFVGAWRALRNRTLDMSVLVALSVGSGYVFSVAATFLFEGEVFYEAAVVLGALAGSRLGGRNRQSQRRLTHDSADALMVPRGRTRSGDAEVLDSMRDPVCGMEVGSRDAVASAVSEGRRFYFCCPRCHAAFLDTPHRYVGWADDRRRPPRAHDGSLASAGAVGASPTDPCLDPCHFPS